jgi:hypothetical protein
LSGEGEGGCLADSWEIVRGGRLEAVEEIWQGECSVSIFRYG